MDTDGGGWVVFQRRMDGTEEFFRQWTGYVKGFGDLNGEFWLGLNKIHRLTKSNSVLRVDLEDFEGESRLSKYTTFKVLDSSTNYTLNVAGYSGDAGDSLMAHNGQEFTTEDRDNDTYGPKNCAVLFHGAWWYEQCHHSNLNGKYLSGIPVSYPVLAPNADGPGVSWYHWKGNYYSLKITEMKLRQ